MRRSILAYVREAQTKVGQIGVCAVTAVLSLGIGVSCDLLSLPALAQERPVLVAHSDPKTALRFTPLYLKGGSTLTLISPTKWADIADQLLSTLRQTHHRYSAMFGSIPALSTRIRLMDESDFYEETGAPQWTNAMFYRGEIIIPLNPQKPMDLDNLHRSVKHEYTHAVVSALSGNKCPGWFDEGLAQWAEGTENPALQPALRDWYRSNGVVPFHLLQGGFTKLKSEMVPAAYAQSLFAATSIMDAFGFQRISDFFGALRNGEEKDEAFEQAFGMDEDEFEVHLDGGLREWQRSKHTLVAHGGGN